MGFLAVLLAQVLDPIRAALVAVVMLIAGRAENKALSYALFLAGLALVAFAVPQFLSMRGEIALRSTLIGLFANAIQAGIIYGLWQASRRWR